MDWREICPEILLELYCKISFAYQGLYLDLELHLEVGPKNDILKDKKSYWFIEIDT